MMLQGNLVNDIQRDIDSATMTFSEIAVKHGVSFQEVNDLARDSAWQAAIVHRELDCDHCYPDPDADYESRYELEDF